MLGHEHEKIDTIIQEVCLQLTDGPDVESSPYGSVTFDSPHFHNVPSHHTTEIAYSTDKTYHRNEIKLLEILLLLLDLWQVGG